MPFCMYILLPVFMYLLVCVHIDGLARDCGSSSANVAISRYAVDVYAYVWVRMCGCVCVLLICACVLYLYIVGQ